MVNLYKNTREDAGIGVRHIPMTIPVATEMGRYNRALEKFPHRFRIRDAG